MNRTLDVRLSYYISAAKRIANEIPFNPVPAATKAKFDRAVQTWLKHRSGVSAFAKTADEMTVRQFLALSEAQRMQVIDSIWQEILTLRPGTTRRDQMVDPAPNALVGLAGLANAFRSFGYCFRCDTRDPAAVTVEGFRRAFEINPPADIQGTLVQRAALGQGMAPQLAMWRDNRDAVSEMTICVSRNLKGCTKFPSPETVGLAYIYAIKLPADQQGFDTENWQATQVGGLWRPGEKAFFDIDAARVIAHVPVNKSLALAPDELHRFQLHANTWTYTASATYADRSAIGSELLPIFNGGAVQAVMRVDDFKIGQ